MNENVLKNKRGFIDVSIVTIISLFFLLSLFVYIIDKQEPIVKYINLNRITRKYAFLMEKDGYLSPSNFQKLKDDLEQKGFDLNDIILDSNKITLSKVGFGEDISIEITYNYKFDEWVVDGLNITKIETIMPIKAYISTTSKTG